MMKYKDWIETLQIAAKYDGGLDKDCLQMWAEHDEHGISFDYKWKLDPKDVRRLAEMGWGLGSDGEYDEEDANKWENHEELSDEELVELFSCYNGVYTYE